MLDLLKLCGFLILLFFYGAYFIKAYLLARAGIQANRMVRGQKPDHTYRVERVLRVATAAMAGVQAFSILLAGHAPLLIKSGMIRWSGLIAASAGVCIFVAAMYTMRDSWRAEIDSAQKTSMVTSGVYRLSRNPAFLGFDLIYLGVAVAFSNPVNLIFALFCVTVMHLQILEEEKFLRAAFGEPYLLYQEKTGRYLTFRFH